jgi:hypothetical protein
LFSLLKEIDNCRLPKLGELAASYGPTVWCDISMGWGL